MNIDIEFFDADGYPSEETLELIRNWDCNNSKDIFEFIHQIWMFDMWTETKKYNSLGEVTLHEYHISTGGWSGNESIIEALQKNFIFWMRYWYQTNKGGHYIFRK